MPKPRKPQQPSDAQKRLAYLEGFIGYCEGHILAPPDLGTPLRKEWVRGWLYAEDGYNPGEERLEELEAENAVLEVKIEELEADIERLTKDKPIKVSSRS